MHKQCLITVTAFVFFAFLETGYLKSDVKAEETFPHCNLSVSFDIQRSLIKGISKITLPENRELTISTGILKITSVKLNGQPVETEIKDGTMRVTVAGTLEIAYEGMFKGQDIRENPENIGVVSSNIISDRGIYLTDRWYPFLDGMAYYSLRVVLPKDFTAISEAVKITAIDTTQGKEYSFTFPHPVNGINLVAGRYRELKETFHGIDIYGYFSPEDISLAETYVKYTEKYIGMYEKLLSPYPYERFSVVENFLPTGYSMPTFTLLGQEVVRLPFIVRTSLGHEMLHQWFGNSVYVNYKGGNWSEGLTTYLSDHLYEELEGKGWQYRKKILTDYESYVNPENEFPLKDFMSRTDFASRAIGYGKGAMLFHMLRKLVGDATFYNSLKSFIKEREFQRASWDDLRTAFEKTSGRSLEWFFSQWLTRIGEISIEIKNPGVVVLKGVPKVSFEVIQTGQPYMFNLPVTINTDKGEITDILKIEDKKKEFEIPVKGSPSELVFDGDYDLMRELLKEEYPPVISRLLGDEKRLVVVPEKDREKYDGLINVFKEEGFAVKEEKEIKDEDIITSSMLVLGYESPILKRLFGSVKKPESGFSLTIRENPLNTSKVIAIADGDSREEVDLASEKIVHYGKYSYIRFEKGKNIEKKTDETERGIRISLSEPVPGIQPKKEINLDEIIHTIFDKPIIYIGELHTNYEDHEVQLKVIMNLYGRGRKFAIGMEMFQKPFQKAIDDYISGAISEREFLKATQYFKRWSFDYNLYREIIEFARAKKIPVRALNLRSEIVDKVSAEGIDALTDEEKKEIPKDMDMSDEDYKRRLEEIFKLHEELESKNFEYFYQSQILWDETMAHSIDEFMKKNPDYQIVVLAGVGHIMYGSGIPERTFRLNGKDYATLIPYSGTVDKNVADFVLFPKPLSPPPTPKLGVVIKYTEGKVVIEKIMPESPAEKAGLEPDDVIISLDNWKVESIDDIKIFLFDKKPGETVKVKILRKRFLFGYKEHEITVTL